MEIKIAVPQKIGNRSNSGCCCTSLGHIPTDDRSILQLVFLLFGSFGSPPPNSQINHMEDYSYLCMPSLTLVIVNFSYFKLFYIPFAFGVLSLFYIPFFTLTLWLTVKLSGWSPTFSSFYSWYSILPSLSFYLFSLSGIQNYPSPPQQLSIQIFIRLIRYFRQAKNNSFTELKNAS